MTDVTRRLMEALETFDPAAWTKKLYHPGIKIRLTLHRREGAWYLHGNRRDLGHIPQATLAPRADLIAALGPAARQTLSAGQIWAMTHMCQLESPQGIWVWWPNTGRITQGPRFHRLPVYHQMDACAVIQNGQVRPVRDNALLVRFPATRHELMHVFQQAREAGITPAL